MTLTTQEEIRAFIELKGVFGRGFNATDYNSFITMKDIRGWEHRIFHVYHGEGVDEDKLIDNEDMIKIASEKNLSEKNGVVEYIKPFLDDETVRPYGHIDRKKSVYKVKVSEIEKIELKPIE